jgi:hypothetical protein
MGPEQLPAQKGRRFAVGTTMLLTPLGALQAQVVRGFSGSARGSSRVKSMPPGIGRSVGGEARVWRNFWEERVRVGEGSSARETGRR